MSYLPLADLEIRLLVLLLLYAVAGAGVLATPFARRAGVAVSLWVWIPIGWLAVTAWSQLLFRLARLAGLAHPFPWIVAATLAAVAALAAAALLRPAPRAAVLAPLRAALAAPRTLAWGLAATLLAANLCLLPLLLNPDLRFFNGIGTDAYGYIRLAQAISHGWYFAPVPTVDPDLALRLPARMWAYLMIAGADRPGAYLSVALTSALTGTGELQGYLLAGALLPVIVAHAALALAARVSAAAATAAAILLAPASALAGNFFQQFYGQCFGVALLLTLPLLSPFGRPLLTGLAAGLTVTLAYDVRWAAVGVAGLAAAELLRAAAEGVWMARLRAAALLAAGCVAGILLAGVSPGVLAQGAPRLFEMRFDLERFAVQSGAAAGGEFYLIAVALPMAAALAAALLAVRWLAAPDRGESDRAGLAAAAGLVLAAAAATLLALATGNGWAAMKSLYLLLPAALLLLLAAGVWQMEAGRPARGGALLLLPVLTGILGLFGTGTMAKGFAWGDAAPLRASGRVPVRLAMIRREQPRLVWIETNRIERYLLLLTELEEARVPSLAPFPVWSGGPGVSFPGASAAAVHAGLVSRTAGQDAVRLTDSDF